MTPDLPNKPIDAQEQTNKAMVKASREALKPNRKARRTAEAVIRRKVKRAKKLATRQKGCPSCGHMIRAMVHVDVGCPKCRTLFRYSETGRATVTGVVSDA